MKTKFLLIGAMLICSLQHVFSQKLTTEKLHQKFTATFAGIFSSKNFSDTTSIKFLKEQETIIMPIFEGAADAWFYFGWYPPAYREKALEEVLARVFIENDSVKLFFYEMPDAVRSSQPWKQEVPYPQLEPDDILKQGDNGRCYVTADDNGVFYVKCYKNVEQKHANAGRYKYIKYEAHFTKKQSFSSVKFITEDGVTVLDHKGIFYFDKLKKKFKDF